MTQGEVLAVFQEALLVAMKISAPLLIASIAIGLVVAIFQAVTQIHEQSIGFALKLIVVIGVLLLAGGWMLDTLKDYTYEIFQLIAS